jgi:hypothetical protein
MSDFPTLTEMGICCPDEITHYVLSQSAKDKDSLKILYKRKKGSFLPERKTFKFGRSAKMVADKNTKSGSIEVFEISPFLQKAVTELDSLVNKHHDDTDLTKLLLKRVDRLEKEVIESTSEIRSIIKSLKKNN